jgi:NMD protein affecting ribosome stability and mRNA decay
VFCPNCGTEVSEDTRFCPECGRQLSTGQNAQGVSEKRLAEAVEKQLKPMYCARCGSLLQVRRLQQNGFDEGTGYPKYDVILACPYVTVYETNVSKEARFTWKKPFDRHTVHKVSKTIELNSDIADNH